MVVHWPKGIQTKGEVRSQFHHVIDVAPTILEAAKLPEPKSVNGTAQIPMAGVSMAYSFDEKAAKDRRLTQYFEIFGNRAIYHDGWLAGTIQKRPGKPRFAARLRMTFGNSTTFRSDFSLVTDLAGQNKTKLAEMQALFMQEAEKYNVLPIDDRLFERLNAEMVGRPDIMAGRSSITLAEGMTGMMENVFLNVKNKSKTITAEIEVLPEKDANGTIIAQGGRFGGWSMYVKNGVPGYEYNFLGLERTAINGETPLPPGKATIKLEFAYDGGGPGKGGIGRLFVNGAEVAEGRINRTQPGIFSADETADVGIDLGTPVVEAIGAEAKSRFSGRIPKVTVDVKALN